MDTTTARKIVDDNAAILERFGLLLRDTGIQVQLLEVIARELFGQTVINQDGAIAEAAAMTPKEMLSAAVQDIMNVGLLGDLSYDLEKLLEGAASLEFLVRYARKVNPKVFPPDTTPSDQVVEAALVLYHNPAQAAVTS